MKSISIARLKQNEDGFFPISDLHPDMKSISIARLKHMSCHELADKLDIPDMKSISIARLKLECRALGIGIVGDAWYEKHLDCEIETYSIPRSIVSVASWNEKHLDCEIETDVSVPFASGRVPPEMKSISIARLKRNQHGLETWALTRWPWNEKHLDCEIETRLTDAPPDAPTSTWNEKHLDCEIETRVQCRWRWRCRRPEMKSISIARLKLKSIHLSVKDILPEMKSISIARLKRVEIWRSLPTEGGGFQW